MDAAQRSNKRFIPATTWMNLKCTVLSERTDTNSYLWCDPIYQTFWKRQAYGDGEQISGCRWLRRREGFDYKGLLRESGGDDGTVLYLGCGGDCQFCAFF